MDIDVGLEYTSYPVAENFSEVVVCVTVERVTTDCAIGFPFSVNLSTTDGSAGIKIHRKYRCFIISSTLV